jgi:hypothetical protein
MATCFPLSYVPPAVTLKIGLHFAHRVYNTFNCKQLKDRHYGLVVKSSWLHNGDVL